MRTSHTVIVCLPADTPHADVLAHASTTLARHGFTPAATMAHFTTIGRRRGRALIQPHNGAAAGGPIRLLDLSGMRTRAQHAAHLRWQIWRQVVAGTPNANRSGTTRSATTTTPSGTRTNAPNRSTCPNRGSSR